MKKILFATILFALAQVSAANITRFEYFFDLDPGFGNGFTLPVPESGQIDENLVIDLTSLNPGLHTLYTRFKDDNNQWSMDASIQFYILLPAVEPVENDLSRLEYYFDENPGPGNGTELSITDLDEINLVSQIDISQLNPGMHSLHVRVSDDGGHWSIDNKLNFYIQVGPIENVEPLDLTRAEYFIDSDPGDGNGVEIPFTDSGSMAETFSVDMGPLNFGIHNLYFRVKDEDNNWSIPVRRMIYFERELPEQIPPTDIVSVNYYISNEFGEIVHPATEYSDFEPGSEVSLDFLIDLPELDNYVGYSLHVYALADNGTSSIEQSREFEYNEFDCNGVMGGDAILDDCGICSEGTTGHQANSDIDCNGDCFGTAFLDDCDVCSGGNSGHAANADMDCTGTCYGQAFMNQCGCVEGSTGLASDWCLGCTNDIADNYCESCTVDNGQCICTTILGDMDRNCALNVVDIVQLVGIIIAGTADDYQSWAGDVTGDGSINVVDIVTLVGIIIDQSLSRGAPLKSIDLNSSDNSVSVLADGKLAGLQLKVRGDFTITNIYLPPGWQLSYNSNTILIFSLDGSALTGHQLFDFSGDLVCDEIIAVDWNGNTIVEDSVVTPDKFSLFAAHPNPFNPTTTIGYYLPENSKVKLSIYNLNGRQVALLEDREISAGYHNSQWNAGDAASGTYLVVFQAGEFTDSRKIVLLK